MFCYLVVSLLPCTAYRLISILMSSVSFFLGSFRLSLKISAMLNGRVTKLEEDEALSCSRPPSTCVADESCGFTLSNRDTKAVRPSIEYQYPLMQLIVAFLLSITLITAHFRLGEMFTRSSPHKTSQTRCVDIQPVDFDTVNKTHKQNNDISS